MGFFICLIYYNHYFFYFLLKIYEFELYYLSFCFGFCDVDIVIY